MVTALAWLALMPWRPILAGDDFGYYDSVLLTLSSGRPLVSDWLAPSTVGLTVPAALLSVAFGDVWAGSMIVMGVAGLLGLTAIWSILHTCGVGPGRSALVLMVVGLSPVFLGKWSRFESPLPAAALMLAALALLLRCLIRPPESWARQLLLCLSGGFCVAWAITIRQNHALAALAGLVALLAAPGLRQRIPLLIAWTLPTALVVAALRLGVPSTFAQRNAVLDTVADQLALLPLLARCVRAGFFAAGFAWLLALLADPRGSIARMRMAAGRGWRLSLIGSLAFLIGALWQALPLAPHTDILALVIIYPVGLGLIVLVGGLVWWPIVVGALRPRLSWAPVGMLLLATAYLGASAVWGYWEYYLLEGVLLLLLVQIVAPTTLYSPPHTGRRGTVAWLFGVAILAALCWATQLSANDREAAELALIEHAFRDGHVAPAEVRQAPFGLLGWNLFPAQVAHWSETRQGFALAFWKLMPQEPSVLVRWDCSAPGVGEEILASKAVRVVAQQRCVSLVRRAPRPANVLSDHRYLPLNAEEWRPFLRSPVSTPLEAPL
jgi:hypothetical protein